MASYLFTLRNHFKFYRIALNNTLILSSVVVSEALWIEIPKIMKNVLQVLENCDLCISCVIVSHLKEGCNYLYFSVLPMKYPQNLVNKVDSQMKPALEILSMEYNQEEI